MPNFISEDQIEQTILKKLKEDHKYRILNCFTKDPETIKDKSKRQDKSEVVLIDILKTKLKELNKDQTIPENVFDYAVEQLIQKRYSISPVLANKEVYQLIKDGIPVEYDNELDRKEQKRIKLLDFDNPLNNNFLAVSQLWIQGAHYFRRPDIIIYINGLPLVFIELKNSNVPVENAYNDNLANYKKDIPLLFQYNAFCILSNARQSKLGSFASDWEYFFNWLRVDDEKEKIDRKEIERKQISIESVIDGLLSKERLIDYIENFVLFYNDNAKIVAQNHQFLGVNKALESFKDRKMKAGKLGVFWHTQGSGKSFSMIFLMKKIKRKFSGNFTFLVITDRQDLDDQIYTNFLSTEAVKKEDVAQPKNGKQLREFLTLNKKIIFTLIHKFKYDKGKQYPVLSEQEDIIVFVDEAHRTQYDSLAENMRTGLPKAQFYAFTGTPLLGSERKTHKFFGEYVSEYNFAQSMDEGATVPLFYQRRVPTVQIQNDNLSEEFYEILEEENLTEKQIEKLENEFSTEMEVIKRDERLDEVARYIVDHFPNRGYLGKGMVVSVDKFTAVNMFNKVQNLWKAKIKELIGQRSKEQSELEKEKIQRTLEYMRAVEMAVVVSEENEEVKKFAEKGLDIKVHREKINKIDENGHDIEFRFKDPADKLQLVFVCAMWITGFDVKTLSTMYIDKPMKSHTLMQTIARANRVSSYLINDVSKKNGEIIDHYNVFRKMKSALREYALGSDDESEPVKDKKELYKLLDESIEQLKTFFKNLSIDINEIIKSEETFGNIKLFEIYADKILEKDEWRKEFFVLENAVTSFYEACKPEIIGDSSRPVISISKYLREIIDEIISVKNVDSALKKISILLDESIIIDDTSKIIGQEKFKYEIVKKGRTWDLSKMDFVKLKEEFKAIKCKNIEIADLRAFLENKLERMIEQNRSRRDFAQRFRDIVDRYNLGSVSVENFYDELVNFTSDLHEEEERAYKEGLTEDELEIYDLLKKKKVTKKEEQKVKLAAKELVLKLKSEKPKVLIQDWYRNSHSRERVRSRIADILDKILPSSYDEKIFTIKVKDVYNMIYEYAEKGEKWIS